ncbi:unnamed protein product [Adineta ricciae]|uniref:Uncharacterized protein n=1 Tax=Adineta ricciae TaxID=249248 RepID=A0A814YAX3_ADIRI|nr:unnamed protein product [Adineta ricciae]CAF1226416.1 unnamed protein product [Adineta ricciae]
MNDTHATENVKDLTWVGLISRAVAKGKLLGSTCHLYSSNTIDKDTNNPDPCVCGRRKSIHSFAQDPLTHLRRSSIWEESKYATEAHVSVYGVWKSKTKFVRWDHTRIKITTDAASDRTEKTSLSTMAEILRDDAKGNTPDLLISCYGGAKYFKMNDKLEKEFMEGIGLAAATEGVWLLTTGLNSGVSKVIGQSVERYALLNEKASNYTVIGLSSWGCLSDRTRYVLKKQTQLDLAKNQTKRTSVPKMTGAFVIRNISNEDILWSTIDENQPDTFETNHTHLLLLDDGSQGERRTSAGTEPFYISDTPRSDLVRQLKKLTECHAVTILVEGGLSSLDVIQHDISAQRPVVIIHGSGRLATAIGNLLELADDHTLIEKEEIKRQLRSFAKQRHLNDTLLSSIQSTLAPANRAYLTLFRLDDKTSLTDTIFLAVFKAYMHRENTQRTGNSEHMKKMLDLAVKWNYINGIVQNTKIILNNPEWSADLFERALLTNRPAIVDYFLRRQHDILETKEFVKSKPKSMSDIAAMFRAAMTTMQIGKTTANIQLQVSTPGEITTQEKDEAMLRASFSLKFIVTQLYAMTTNIYIKSSYPVCSPGDLDRLYYRLIGPYTESFFYKLSTRNRLANDIRNKLRSLLTRFKYLTRKSTVVPLQRPDERNIDAFSENNTERIVSPIIVLAKPDPLQVCLECFPAPDTFGSQEMLREIFLWAVIEGYSEMAFILLLQIKSRISAALIAAGITSRLMSTYDGYLDRLHKFRKQSSDYERFATACIDDCYRRNERRACQLLLRETPLFGNVTCMQIAISSRIRSFINSRCFNQVLNRQWYGVLCQSTNRSLLSKILFIMSLLSMGLLAPLLITYRNDFPEENQPRQFNISTEEKDVSLKQRRWEGIEDQDGTKLNYIQKVRHFHRTPIVRMSYDFLFYIWMLLAFSNVMLFEMKSPHSELHWTEIYVIVTISLMLIEDIRKCLMEYITQMLERWHQSDMWMIFVYAPPYVLFYIGIALKFASKIRPDFFTPARIVLAIDLELWFLFSLRFVSAVKLLGPKLFMIRNMLRDLTGFIYIIFVCIAAYGIVSRSLTRYSSIEMNAKNLSSSILYRPYWFLYSIVDDERNELDGIIESPSSSSDEVFEATVNQILLAFHMLFINILILNLLIAVFNFTIMDVQDKSEYLWRYQRYELIRNYFEQPLLAFPPLSIVGYFWTLLKYCLRRRDVARIFKRFATKQSNNEWTNFENAATYSYTRTFVDRMYADSSTLVIPTFSETDELKAEIEDLKRKNNEMRVVIDNLNAQSKLSIPAMNWMMTAMDRVKMSSQRPPPLLVSASAPDTRDEI